MINVLKDARNVCGDVPLWAVIGGFHLSGEKIEQIILATNFRQRTVIGAQQ